MKELEYIIENIKPIEMDEKASISELAVIVSNEIYKAANEAELYLSPSKNDLHVLINNKWKPIEIFLLRKFLMDCSIKVGMNRIDAIKVSYINKILKQIIVSSSIYRSQYK